MRSWVVVAVCLAASVANAATINVTSFTDTNAGLPAGLGAGVAGDLRAAIKSSNVGDTIDFTCATAPCTITLSGPLYIDHDLTIDGGAVGRIVIDGAGTYRAFWIETGTVALANLLVRNVLAQGGNGGTGATARGGGGAGLGAGVFVDTATATAVLVRVVFGGASAVGGRGGLTGNPTGGLATGGGGLGGSGGTGSMLAGTGGGGILSSASGRTPGVGWSAALGNGGAGSALGTPASGQFGGGGSGMIGAGVAAGSGGFGGGGGGAQGTAITGGAGGPGGGGGGTWSTASTAGLGGALGATVRGGDGRAGGGGSEATGDGGGGAAAGPAVFVYAGSLFTSDVYYTTVSATVSDGATADATPVFSYAGTVNGTMVAGPFPVVSPVFSVASLPDGSVGALYSQAITASFGTGATTVTATGLPGGLALSNGTLSGTPTTAGSFSVVLTATDPASDSVSQTLSLTIGKGWQAITFDPQNTPTYTDGTFTVSATATSGLAVTFASTTPSVCTVSGTTVAIVKAGSCTIAASQVGDASWSAATPVSATITIGQDAQTVTFSNPGNQAYASGGTFAVAATASSGEAVTFASSTPSVCTVSGTTVAIVTTGTCTITASAASDANYTAASKTDDITIGLADQTIAFASPGDQTFTSGGTFMVSATASSGLPVTFTSQTPSVCMVSGTTVTIVATGTCAVAADQAGDGNYGAAPTVTQDISIGLASQTLTFASPGDQAFATGTVVVSAMASSGLDVTITSTTPDVCTTASDVVTFVKPGTCTLDASQAGNADYAAAQDVTVSFEIAKATSSMTLVVNPSSAKTGDAVTLTATITGDSPSGTVDFTDGATSLCAGVTVSSGTATCTVTLPAGAHTVTASYSGDANNASAMATTTVTVKGSGGCSYAGTGSNASGLVLVLIMVALAYTRMRRTRSSPLGSS